MVNKKFLRKVFTLLFWLVIIYIGVLVILLLNLHIFIKPCLIIAYISFIIALKAWLIPLCIIKRAKMIQDRNFYKMYNKFKIAFKELNNLHERRYKLYFSSGNTNEINKLTEAIQKNGKTLVDTGNMLISKGNFDKTKKELIQDIIDETTLLMQNESVTSKPKRAPI